MQQAYVIYSSEDGKFCAIKVIELRSLLSFFFPKRVEASMVGTAN